MVAYIVNFTDPEVTPFNVNSFTTDGPVAPNTLQLSSSAVKASTSLVLYGKGHPQYGERIQENLVNLLENFSGATPPTFARSGQTWFSRNTYVLIGLGSPATTNTIFRWTDDSSSPNGGAWTALAPVLVNPTAVDQVKIGTQPTAIFDGSFWLDTDGSPAIPELYLAVNSSTSNLSSQFLKRELEDLTGLVTLADITSASYKPQKQLKVFDGVEWKNSGNAYTSDVAPQNPAEGDFWFQTGQPGSPTNPQNQLFIWQNNAWRETGYVDIGGGTMTGALYFGLPTSSLVIWENGGNDATGSDIRFVTNGLLSSDDNLYIHINNDSPGSPGADSNIFEVAAGSDARDGTQTSLFRVRADGVLETAQALGSPEGSTYTNLILSLGDANSLVHRAYVDDVIASAASLTIRVTNNESAIAILSGGGSPTLNLEAKVNRIGDTMTGTLNFVIGGSPQLGQPGIDMGDLLIQSLQYPQAPEDAANRQYVDDQIAILFGSPTPAGFNDGVVFTGSFDSGSNNLTLNRTEGLADVIIPFSFSFPASDVEHTPLDTPYLRDLFQERTFGSPLYEGSPITDFAPGANQEQINETALEDLNARLATVESPFAREIITLGVGSPLTGGGSPALNLTTISFTIDTYIVGTNRLRVFVNGVKQYANERAWQKMQFAQNSVIDPLTYILQPDPYQPNLSSTTRTQLDLTTTYTLDIAVDGGGTTTVTALGSALQNFGDIVTQITAQTTATAVWSNSDQAIYVYSNTTGTGSQIIITDSGSPNSTLLGALSTIPLVGSQAFGVGSPTPGVGSPQYTYTYAYTLGGISPAASGPISLVSQNLAYFEATAGSPATDATFGEQASTVVFNSQLQPGDVIELINVPVSG